MKRLLFIFIAIGVLTFTAFAAADTQTVIFDIALDGNSMAGVGLPSNGPPQRGNTFIINGKLFPYGTLYTGSQQNNPNAANNIGDFYCRATVANNIPAAPALPELFNTQIFRFNSQDQLITEGIESAAPGTIWTRAVIGGTGIYLGASGSENIQVLGTNASGGFNERVVFKLVVAQ